MQISLPSSAMGQRRLYKRATGIIFPNISITRSCGSTPMLFTESIRPPPPLILDSIPCLSDFRRSSSFGVGASTHTVVVVIRYPRSTFFCIPPNSSSALNSTSLIDFMLQKCRNTCTRLWILYIRSSQKRGYFEKALSYCRSKQSM